jgi:hypothetical protein
MYIEHGRLAMGWKIPLSVFIVLIVVATWVGQPSSPVEAADSDPLASMVHPQYKEDGALIRPLDYRKWVFVGSSLGLSYFGKEDPKGPGAFHHIYMQPEAYDHYVETGKFPEKTMLVMENYSAGAKGDNTADGKVEGKEKFKILHGHFEDAMVGVEVALKDSETFEDGWAYFMFNSKDGLLDEAKAFPKSVCYSCHVARAADDNVFVQFYPVLREHYEKRIK